MAGRDRERWSHGVGGQGRMGDRVRRKWRRERVREEEKRKRENGANLGPLAKF